MFSSEPPVQPAVYRWWQDTGAAREERTSWRHQIRPADLGVRRNLGVNLLCKHQTSYKARAESRHQLIFWSDTTSTTTNHSQQLAASLIKGSPQASLDIGEKTRQIPSHDVTFFSSRELISLLLNIWLESHLENIWAEWSQNILCHENKTFASRHDTVIEGKFKWWWRWLAVIRIPFSYCSQNSYRTGVKSSLRWLIERRERSLCSEPDWVTSLYQEYFTALLCTYKW